MKTHKKLPRQSKPLEVKIAAKVGAGDKLFGSVNNINVSEALEKAGHTIDKKFISVTGGNVKRLGKYAAKVRLHQRCSCRTTFRNCC